MLTPYIVLIALVVLAFERVLHYRKLLIASLHECEQVREAFQKYTIDREPAQELAELRAFLKTEPDLELAWKWKCEAVDANAHLDEAKVIWNKERGAFIQRIHYLENTVAVQQQTLTIAAEKQVALAKENITLANAAATG